MSTPFLSSEEYDERAHELYNEGNYDLALETLREGLTLYPAAVELHVEPVEPPLRGLEPRHLIEVAGLERQGPSDDVLADARVALNLRWTKMRLRPRRRHDGQGQHVTETVQPAEA